MMSSVNAPLTLSSRLLTQNVQIVIEVDPWFELSRVTTTPMLVSVTNDKIRTCYWKFVTTLEADSDMKITAELSDVINDSELKVILRGVILNSNGMESDIHSMTGGVIKKKGHLNLTLGSAVNWSEYIRSFDQYHGMVTAHLDMVIEYLDQTIPNKDAAMNKFLEISCQDFSEAMKELLALPSFKNAKIVCADGVEISVNKEFLRCRSPVFEAMFRTDMMEASTGVVKINDICGKSMKVFVEYLTSGKLDESWHEGDVVTHLAVAADKYGIQSLRVFLNDWLGEEDLVRSNLELLNMAADCGYSKAEVEIAVNVGKRAKDAKTRDELLSAIGMKKETMDKQRKKLVDKELKRWMNCQLGDQSTVTESSLELVNLAADEGLGMAERKLVKELGERLDPARSRDEVLQVLGIGGK